MIYLDYNATTPLCRAAADAMRPFLDGVFGNPSSVHAAGRRTRAAVDDARDRMAALLHAQPHELIFTASGTESDNLAVIGLARAHRSRGRHLICGSTEHHAVLHAFEFLQRTGEFEVTFLPVDRHGLHDPDQLAQSIRSDTALVSIMTANNETGVIQPMERIAAVCNSAGVLLHSDMVQAFGKLPIDLRSSHIHAATFAAHKFHGPPGAGLLYLRAGVPLEPIQFGGAHENQRRPGTENVAAIAGMAAAAEWIVRDREQEQLRQRALGEILSERIRTAFPGAVRNGSHCLSNTLNVSFPGFDSETLLMALDLEGVCASSGSACMVGSVVASHVLLAMGCDPAHAASAVRFSLGHETTAADIEVAAEAIQRIVERVASVRAPSRRAGSYAAA